MKLSKPVVGVIVVLVSVMSVVAAKIILYKKAAGVAVTKVLLTPRAKGNPAAPVKIREYTDFQCPACSRAVTVVHDLFEKYPGKIYFELKYFPLPMHPFAKRAAIFTECAAEQGKFWLLHDVIYKSQSSWSKMAAVDPYFSELAVSLGIDGARLSACVNGGMMEPRIKKDVDEGDKLGVSSTPTFFVNGKMVVGTKDLLAEVERLLK